MSALSPAAGLALRAKRLEMQAAHRLAARIALVDALRECIHALQRERGASSLYLASGGVRFAGERHGAIAAGAPALERLAALLAAQGDAAGAQGDDSSGSAADADVDAPMLCHMAWVLLGLEALPAQRAAIEARQTSAQDAIAAYSQCIAGMVQLLSHVADASLLPGLHSVSHALVALLHLVQAKEAAGQERAAGAQMLASGRCEGAPQERIVHLIDAQEQGLRVFTDFADAALRAEWEGLQLGPGMVRLERLRRVLCAARPGAVLDAAASEEWFTVTSERIGALAACEATLVHHLRTECARHAAQARQELQDSEGLLRRLREAPPAVPPLPGGEAAALHGLLQAQAERLQRTETELQAARRALAERRVIERAKGVLMERLGLSEEAAFRTLQKASMDQNRRLLDVAEAALALPGLVSVRAKEI
jgi:hypothetical protein